MRYLRCAICIQNWYLWISFRPSMVEYIGWIWRKYPEYCILLTAYAVPVHLVECVRTSGKGALVFVGLKSPDGQWIIGMYTLLLESTNFWLLIGTLDGGTVLKCLTRWHINTCGPKWKYRWSLCGIINSAGTINNAYLISQYPLR